MILTLNHVIHWDVELRTKTPKNQSVELTGNAELASEMVNVSCHTECIWINFIHRLNATETLESAAKTDFLNVIF